MRFLLAVIAAAAPLAAQAGGGTLQVDVARLRLAGCPAATAEEQQVLFAQRLATAATQLRAVFGPSAPNATDPIRLMLCGFDVEARADAAKTCGLSLQGRGALGFDARRALLTADADARTDTALWRAAVHAATQLLVHDQLPREVQDSLGYGWLATGLAHRAELATGSIDAFVVRGAMQQPLRFLGGDWRRGAAELLGRGRLPAIDALLRTEADDFDPGQHVLACCLVDWLLSTQAVTTHGASRVASPIEQLVEAAHRGTSSATALAEIAGVELPVLEQRLHAFVRERGDATDGAAAGRNVECRHHAVHPHAAVFVYTTEPILERHRDVVRKALRQRHAAHTSGWKRVDGKPLLAVGPVNQAAGFWHGDEIVKDIPRTWPMVAVLEYAAQGDPSAQIDCFRRVRDNGDDTAWMLDPGVGFVEHHNAQFVTAHDDRFRYLAVPDTPTGSHVGGSEFVHRGRVRWANGEQASVGVWTWLEAPKTATTQRWYAVSTPLVDWRIDDSSRERGARSVRAVDDLTRELSPWGTDRVFRFPEIPAGLFAARG